MKWVLCKTNELFSTVLRITGDVLCSRCQHVSPASHFQRKRCVSPALTSSRHPRNESESTPSRNIGQCGPDIRTPGQKTANCTFHGRQGAQLSQRDRAMLRVVEYFAKSLKVIRINFLEKGMCKSPLVGLFQCNYGSISYRFWDIQRQVMARP